MSEQAEQTVSRWLYIVCAIIVGLVAFGGYVRLTRSGLSIVEWNVISGILPPIGEAAWMEEFTKYQQTPEFIKVNADMTLEGYKRIFYLEYFHRLIARIAGLFVVLPLAYFLIRGTIPWRKSGIYFLIAFLFAFQGYMGWYMVSSGLVDRPAVSHYRLTIHLALAVLLLGITLWKALGLTYGAPGWRGPKSGATWLSIALVATLTVQILYGGLVAGMKAGHASDTWPLMFGYLVPPGIFTVIEPWWHSLLEAASTVHFTHRWFAWAVLAVAALLFVVAKRERYSATVDRALGWMVALTGLQILLGISVIWFHVPLSLALLHQALAMVLFIDAIFLTHRTLSESAQQLSQQFAAAQVAA